jgi:diguanylate cyclase (GGDEF)-like protein
MAEGLGLKQERTEHGSIRVPARLPRLRPEPESEAVHGPVVTTSSDPRGLRSVRRPTSRATEILTYLCGAIGIVLLWSLWRAHLVSQRPLWLLLLVLFFAAGVGWLGDAVQRSHRSTGWLHLKVACQSASVTAIIYLVGWGPALAIGYALPLLNTGFFVGRRGRWALVVWPAICLGCGQIAVSTGGARLLIASNTSNALALVDVLAVLFVWLRIHQLANGSELAERDLTIAASQDPLTGLMSRQALASGLSELVGGDEATRRPVAVLSCDMLGFKDVNDLFGHDGGDRALTEVSRRLRATFRSEDLIARFAGDEFVVALSTPREPGEVVTAAERVLDALEVPVRLGSGSVLLRMSIGIAFSSTGAMGAYRLLEEADRAMYEAKALDRSSWVLRELD